ncbi:DUF4383 domain-containing protein [Halomarina halobia]|uniref:DUF4383 domain-containing protein n=1 Tax=Halomarina halobia TaxID=3033386 RepID=A0ABD6AF78_9EURY|nr:DUF4383 domain-containing protein [Halomarina sp. PSR21]
MASNDIGSRHLQVWASLFIGGALLLVGIAGFLQAPEEGLLFGVFGVNAFHNAFHAVTGIAGLSAGWYRRGAYAPTFNLVVGLVFLLLFLSGLVASATMNELLNANTADDFLHLFLGIVLLGAWIVADRVPRERAART